MESETSSRRHGTLAQDAPSSAATGTTSGAASRSGEQANNNASTNGADAAASTITNGATPSSSRSRDRTLDDVMRDPSTTLPDVVVLDSMPEGVDQKEVLDPKEDLWLSTADGRFSSPVIPLHVGVEPYMETFYVHKDVLIKSKYFERALCGGFREARTQSIDLPEENPAIFHFLIAYLYEGKYHPIRPAASVLIADQDKGKGKEGQETGGDSDSDDSVESYNSDVTAASRNRRERRRRREDRLLERMRQKRPGSHRPTCGCPQCLSALGPPCWYCRAPRSMPPQPPMPPGPGMAIDHRDYMGRQQDRPRRPPRRRHGAGPGAGPMAPPPPPPGWVPPTGTPPARIAGEDLRTWLLAYELNIDVYILANKFLLDGFKTEIARAAIDMLETAGTDAAVPDVLYLCRKLYDGLSENDNLLKMIFARVGFLQPWRKSPEETNAFLVANPGIAPLLLREMASRRTDEAGGRPLPSMERPWYPPAGVEAAGGGPNYYRGAPHHHPYYRGPPRW